MNTQTKKVIDEKTEREWYNQNNVTEETVLTGEKGYKAYHASSPILFKISKFYNFPWLSY